eukprot:TRINITY_DN44646_c0_g1_i1.p1 TRINITY_DN44646_c0_g1~~TRINITY_DN44646_c0_g1_i1.p1  ORF type:complete len:379 (+),score=48.55 TRINITY_DN44646_c0_g1_i1:79-1215(+)
MGIPSPYLGTADRPNLVKPTPEMPTMDQVAVEEGVDAEVFESLPTSVVDMEYLSRQSSKAEFQMRTTPVISTTGSDSFVCPLDAPTRDKTRLNGNHFISAEFREHILKNVSMRNTFVELFDEEDVDPRPRAFSEGSGLDEFKRCNVSEVAHDFAASGYVHCVPSWDLQPEEGSAPMATAMYYMPIFQHGHDAGVEDTSSSETRFAMPLSAAEVACAPPSPAAGSYLPIWKDDQLVGSGGPPSTLDVGNLPTTMWQEDFVEILDREGFSGFYDFVYMPFDISAGKSFGKAVVNLTRHEYGLALAARLHGRSQWGGFGISTAPCEVNWSGDVQGFTDLVGRYRDGPENMDEVPTEHRPLVFSQGWPEPFPCHSQVDPARF